MTKKITMAELKKEIRRQNREIKTNKRIDFSFLGFVENKDMTPEIEKLFTFHGLSGYIGYDWIRGNEKMDYVINKTTGRYYKL